MSNRILDVVIIGVGNRGVFAYGQKMYARPDRFRIVADCDIREESLLCAKTEFHLKDEQLFRDSKEFFAKKRGDLCLVCTLDDTHVEFATKAMELGYDVLCEKPISSNKQELLTLLETQRKHHNKVMICHVLRYANAFVKVKQLLEEGVVGDIVNINAIEQIAFWHMAHSFVRGNWHKVGDGAPLILAKSCHDLDYLVWFISSKCKTVSSFGGLSYFDANHAPEGATERCLDCPHKDTCLYSAPRFYIDKWQELGALPDVWPFSVPVQINDQLPITKEKMEKALRLTDYGRCVFKMNNDCATHQTVMMQFANGSMATLTVMAFTGTGGRVIRIHGTKGEIDLDEEKAFIEIKVFGKDSEVIPFDALLDASKGHGGGDEGLVEACYHYFSTDENVRGITTLEESIESHLIGIAAEESRLDGGKIVHVHK